MRIIRDVGYMPMRQQSLKIILLDSRDQNKLGYFIVKRNMQSWHCQFDAPWIANLLKRKTFFFKMVLHHWYLCANFPLYKCVTINIMETWNSIQNNDKSRTIRSTEYHETKIVQIHMETILVNTLQPNLAGYGAHEQ